jgi:Rrf2 family protein
MKVTNKADYALHAMLYIASKGEKAISSINQIAEAEDIPREYLAKILKELVQRGFLKSHKGIKGGYSLTRARANFTFLDIIEGIDGPMFPTNCTRPESKRHGHRRGKCAAFAHFDTIKRNLLKDLGAISFGDIPYEKFYSVSGGEA